MDCSRDIAQAKLFSVKKATSSVGQIPMGNGWSSRRTARWTGWPLDLESVHTVLLGLDFLFLGCRL